MPLLASEQVRFVGEPVAVVIADDPYAAEDAAEVANVEWTPLPAVADLTAACAAGAPQVHGELTGNCLVDLTMFDDDRLCGIFAAAPVVIDAVFTSARVAALPMEGRACLADWDDRDDQLVVHVSTQVPHQVRSGMRRLSASRAQRPGDRTGRRRRLRAEMRVGREEVVVAGVAMRLRRPVAWVEDRQENLTASFHGHEQRYDVRAAFGNEGRILGLAAEIDCDVGAYSAFPFTCAVEPLMAASEAARCFTRSPRTGPAAGHRQQQGTHRAVPWCVTATDRSGHGTAHGAGRARARPGSAARAPGEHDRAGRVSLYRRHRHQLRRGQLPRVARPGRAAGHSRRLARGAGPAPQRRPARRDRLLLLLRAHRLRHPDHVAAADADDAGYDTAQVRMDPSGESS